MKREYILSQVKKISGCQGLKRSKERNRNKCSTGVFRAVKLLRFCLILNMTFCICQNPWNCVNSEA